MEQQVIDERSLIIAYRDAKQKRDELFDALQKATAEEERIEKQLIELLESKDAKSTAKYLGVGYVSLMKPRLYANYLKENEEVVFEFIKNEGRDDLIRPTINKQSLSGFIGECVEGGKEVPQFISYYLKPSVRIYPA